MLNYYYVFIPCFASFSLSAMDSTPHSMSYTNGKQETVQTIINAKQELLAQRKEVFAYLTEACSLADDQTKQHAQLCAQVYHGSLRIEQLNRIIKNLEKPYTTNQQTI